MRTFFIGIIAALCWTACTPATKTTAPLSFQLATTFALDSLAPIGLAVYKDQLWVSDGDNNRLVSLTATGEIDQLITGLERPMHLDSDEDYLYVPEYGIDSIRLINATGKVGTLPVGLPLDAPAGVSISGDNVALADFYNHQVVYYHNQQWKTLGKKGNGASEFHYPTDVQWTNDALYVADAYNHRVQVFDHQGQHLRTIGEQDSMNAATGIHVQDSLLAVTDFEQNRVLIYSTNGPRLQIIAGGLDKPTDVLFWKGDLYVLNYGNGALQRYTRQ